MSYENHNISGDLAVGRDVNIGGDTTIAGRSKFKGAVKIDGILDAKHIKGAQKGLFTSATELNKEFPAPHTGWHAIVLDAEDETKGLLYVAENGRWIVKSTVPQPFQFLVDSINAFVSKRELTRSETELLARLQGKSESSDAVLDPFKFLGEFNDPNGADFLAALDGLHSVNKEDGYEGCWRVTVAGKPSVLYNFAMNYPQDKWLQGLITVYSPHTNPAYTFTINNKVDFLCRTLENGVWSKWRSITQDNTDEILAEKTRATEAESNLKSELNEVRTAFTVQDWKPGYYINSDSGEVVGTVNPSAVTDFIELNGVQSIEVQGRAVGGLVALLAFYDADKVFISSISSTTNPYIVNSIPNNAAYVRATGNNDENDRLAGYTNIANVLEKIETVQDAISVFKAQRLDSTAFNIAGYYINSNSGEVVGTVKPSAVTDFIELNGVQSIEVQGRAVGGLVALLAFYDADKVFISSISSTTNPYIVNSIPNNAAYVRATGNNDENDYIVLRTTKDLKTLVDELQPEVDELKSEVDELKSEVDELKFKSNILLTGASFAYSGNQWPALLSKKLGITCYNKAVSGSSILHTARLLYENTLYTAEELENFDILMIMHVHNVDVFNTTTGKELMGNYENYEDAIFFPKEYSDSKPANMSYAQAYDYVLKKYAADCYALKDKATSKWYGLQMGKPFNVVCLTHWHDARTLFNNSIRLLKDKWGFALIELDKEIGFTKELTHPVTKEQVSLLYAIDTENIDGVSYGWHPDRREVNGEPPIIQQRIAEIVTDSLLRPQSQIGIVEMEKGRALAKRDLFIAAGALYNDNNAAITRTAPWGESVQHLAGHYYLNGLGDITEEQMTKIYNRGYFNDNDKAALGYGSHNPVRTNLCRKGMWNAQGISGSYFAYGTAAETLNLHITTANTVKTTFNFGLATSEQFVGNAPNLRIIDPRAIINTTTWSTTAFAQCPKLEEVRINLLKSNIVFKDSPVLSKASVLYLIQNAAPTTAITITLHADAYARLESDADIVTALEAQPLITLVSA